MGFFADLSAIVNIADFCDQIANELFLLNQDNICLTADDLTDANLDELLDLIENGLRVEPPSINFDCPDREGFLNDPTITKSVPEAFNALVETVEMQFISSADSVKSVLLEQVLKTGVIEGVETGSLGTLDTSFLTPIINTLNALSDFDLDSCDIDISTILGPDAAAALDATETGLGILSDTVSDPNFINAIGSLSSKLANINSGAESGQPIYTSYEFNQEFYNEFVNYIIADTIAGPSGDNQLLTIDTSFVSRRQDPAAGPYVSIYFRFPRLIRGTPPQVIELRYPSTLSDVNEDDNWTAVSANLDNLIPGDTELQLGSLLTPSTPLTSDTLTAFVESMNLSADETVIAENGLFPAAYASLVDNMFDYVVENGVFDAATLQSLNFFHLNENCPPSEVADLLDVDGILKQMRTEYLESACNDENIPQRTKIRNMIKFGMYLLLIQIQIAEFIIKNIFVFSAFKIDDLFENNFIKSFMRQQATSSIISYLTAQGVADTTVRQDLVSYFNLKINRRSVVTQGGIKFSNGDIAFPTGTQFSIVDNGAFVGFDEIIDYLISERLMLGATAVNNAIKKSIPGNNPVPLGDALTYSMKTFEVSADSKDVILEAVRFSGTSGKSPYLVFMTVKETTQNEAGETVELPVYTLQRLSGGYQPKVYNFDTLDEETHSTTNTDPYMNTIASTNGNRISYYVARSFDDDEFEILHDAENNLRGVEYGHDDVVMFNAVPMLKIITPAVGPSGNMVNPPDKIGWRVNGRLDGDVNFLEDPESADVGDLITTRSYKLWFYWEDNDDNLALLGDFGSRTFRQGAGALVPSKAPIGDKDKDKDEDQGPFNGAGR
jgi:hypothetical protein